MDIEQQDQHSKQDQPKLQKQQFFGLSLCIFVLVFNLSNLIYSSSNNGSLQHSSTFIMSPITALVIMLCAISLLLLFLKGATKYRIAICILCTIPLLITIITLFEDVFGNTYITESLSSYFDVQTNHKRITSASAYCCLLFVIAILANLFAALDNIRNSIINTCITIILVISALGLLSQVMTIFANIEFWENASMSFNAAIGWIIISISLLAYNLTKNTYQWLLDRLTSILFIIGMVMIVVAAAESYYFTDKLQKNIKAVAYQQDIIIQVMQIMRDSATLQDLQRGYVITGNLERLEGREEIIKSLNQNIDDYDDLIPDDSEEQQDINELRTYITQRNAWEQKTIDAAKKYGVANAQRLIATGTGINLTKQIDSILAESEKNHSDMLDENRKIAEETSIKTFTLLPLQLFFSMTILVFGLCIQNKLTIERKSAEVQLRHSQKMEAIGQLTGGIAHDFNNLLGIIIGNIELLTQMIVSNAAVTKRIDAIQNAAQRGADLTKRLLAFSRMQQLNPTVVSLDEVLSNIVEMARPTIGRDIKIVAKLNAMLPNILVDVAGLESALLNIIVNSRDAMPDGGTITIAMEEITLDKEYISKNDPKLNPGTYIRILISDTGTGMSKEILSKIFEPFFTTKTRGKGSGLGLAMVYGFVKQSQGIIKVYSEIGHGTTFSIYLPVTQQKSETKLQVLSMITQNIINKSVLIVDDEPALLEIAINYLREIGFKTFQATDGNSALEILRTNKSINLLVTDVIMPGGMNGVQLAIEAKKILPDLKIVYISGYPADALSEKSGMQINYSLINKPYNKIEFINTINKVMQ